MKTIAMFMFFCLMAASSVRASLPGAPTEASHPGSLVYSYSVFKERVQIDGRSVDFFAPAEMINKDEKAPVIIFAHGQSLSTDNYTLLFEHLAKKGFAVVSPAYSTGFFDQNWRRMGQDYLNLSQKTLKRYEAYVDPQTLVFSGHSKGAYVALVAAGLANASLQASSLVLFAPAGQDADITRQIDKDIPVSIIYSDKDTIISQSTIDDIFSTLPGRFNQLITVKSYASLDADHYHVMTKKFFLGGRDGFSAFHHYGSMKWLVGAAQDVILKENLTNKWIYGSEATTKGIDGLQDEIRRNW